MTLQEISRQAAVNALRIWNQSDHDSDPMYDVADAVTLAAGQVWARYRPQHHDDCGKRKCAHIYEGPLAPCTCGLDALLASLVIPQEQEQKELHGAGLIHQTIPDMAGTEPRPSFCPTCGTGLGED
jgi:hypothetical protein